ncbi:MAG: phosphoribosyltransferase [Planctomycetota bacterium]|jgi:predicted phosphoribosyltransferase
MVFEDRVDAGRQLAQKLTHLGRTKPIVLALPRGGVVVGYEVSRAMHAPLDVIVARKMGAPDQPEFGFGAVGPGDVRVLDQRSVRLLGLTNSRIERIATHELAEMARREELYRQGRPAVDVAGRTIILVDDGAATGVTMQAAIQSARMGKPERIVCALPVAPPETAQTLALAVDELICLDQPTPFAAVGQWYRSFAQASDEEVVDLLKRSHGEVPAPTTAGHP